MTQPIRSHRILLVEDEPTVRATIRMFLEVDGHQVEAVGSGTEALEKLETKSYDFVFTDLNMEGMSGDQLARAIKQKYPRQTIAMITAYAEVLDQQTQSRTPVDFIVSKPCNLRSIQDILRR